jgi:hypothetical protein
MRRRAGTRLTLVATMLAAGLGAAAAEAATSAAFPDPGGGARSIALGGYLVALPIDDLALESNPARLAYAAGTMSAQVDRLDPDLDLWRGRFGIAFGLGPTAAEPLQSSQPRRMVIGTSIGGQGLTLVEGSAYNEATFAAGVAYAPISMGAIGLVGRYQRAFSDVVGAEATGFGIDVGLSLDLAEHWDIALAIRDAFGRTTFENSVDEDRAARLTVGVATARRRWWQAEVDYVFQRNVIAALAFGGEIHVVPGTLDLRAGVARETEGVARTVPSFGAGLLFGAFRLDYAFRSDPDGAFETQHRAAVGARF